MVLGWCSFFILDFKWAISRDVKYNNIFKNAWKIIDRKITCISSQIPYIQILILVTGKLTLFLKLVTRNLFSLSVNLYVQMETTNAASS